MKEYERKKLVMAINGAQQYLNDMVKLNGKDDRLLEIITETRELIKALQKEQKEFL